MKVAGRKEPTDPSGAGAHGGEQAARAPRTSRQVRKLAEDSIVKVTWTAKSTYLNYRKEGNVSKKIHRLP